MRKSIGKEIFVPLDIQAKIHNVKAAISPEQAFAKQVSQMRLLALKGAGYVNVYQGYDSTQSAFFAPGATTDLINITVPSGGDNALVLLKYANYTSDIAAWGYFTWNMYIDGMQVPEYSNVSDQLGLQYQMREIGIDILIKAGQTFRIEVVADAAMPIVVPQYTAGISLIGVFGTFYRGVL